MCVCVCVCVEIVPEMYVVTVNLVTQLEWCLLKLCPRYYYDQNCFLDLNEFLLNSENDASNSPRCNGEKTQVGIVKESFETNAELDCSEEVDSLLSGTSSPNSEVLFEICVCVCVCVETVC